MKSLILKIVHIACFLALISASLIACNGRFPNQENNQQFSNSINTNSFEGSNIIGGTLVKQSDKLVTSIVGIESKSAEGKGTCTGSILENNIVLTAAHCVGPYMKVVFGVDMRYPISVADVDLVVVHPNWRLGQFTTKSVGDLALLRFIGHLPSGFEPAKLLTTDFPLRRGAQVLLAGYGISDAQKEDGEMILRKTSVEVADAQFSSTEVALDQTHGTGACHGDSGGPAYFNANGTLLLWGVTSRGYDDNKNRCDRYAIYTSILAYSSWIKRTINKMQPLKMASL